MVVLALVSIVLKDLSWQQLVTIVALALTTITVVFEGVKIMQVSLRHLSVHSLTFHNILFEPSTELLPEKRSLRWSLLHVHRDERFTVCIGVFNFLLQDLTLVIAEVVAAIVLTLGLRLIVNTG